MNRTAFVWTSLILLAGCRVEATPEPLDLDAVAPIHFTDGQEMWRKEGALTAEDQKLVERFFQTRPAWRDSTELEGTPIVYRCGDQRRFYWIRPAHEQAIWTCIHWEQKRFRVSNGSGSLGPTTD